MSKRNGIVFLATVFYLAAASPSEAQLLRRLFSPPNEGFSTPSPERGTNPAGRGTNPDHERRKTEADKAQQAGDFQRAIDLVDPVLRENPRDAVAYYLRAGARVELGIRKNDTRLIRGGIADAREAIRNDQRTPMYYLPYLHGMKNLAVLENRRDHAETSVKAATQALAQPGLSNEDRANLLFQRAQAQGYLAKVDEAVADLDEALRLVPNHFGAQAVLADVLLAAGKTERAAAAFNKLVENFPDNPLSHNNRGMFLQREGKFNEAVTDFSRAVERDPNYFYSYTNRGFTFLQMDNPTAAEADFNASLKIQPQQPMVYNMRGLAKLSRGDVTGALEDQRTVLSMLPKDSVAQADLGFLQFFAADFPAAVASFDAATAGQVPMRHLLPWKIVALKRMGKNDNVNALAAPSVNKDAKSRDWTDHLVAYLTGAEKEADLLTAAGSADQAAKPDQLCEAHYFIGLSQPEGPRSAKARESFERAVATKARRLSAYRGAQLAVMQAGGQATQTATIPSAGSTAPPTIIPGTGAPGSAGN
jgi:lipoprotein NlpI